MRINLGELTVLFVGLKLSGHVSWPWWKVVAPTAIEWAVLAAYKFWERFRR